MAVGNPRDLFAVSNLRCLPRRGVHLWEVFKNAVFVCDCDHDLVSVEIQ